MQQFTGYIARPGDAPFILFQGSFLDIRDKLLYHVMVEYDSPASRKLCARLEDLTEDTRNWVGRLDGLEFGLLREAKK